MDDAILTSRVNVLSRDSAHARFYIGYDVNNMESAAKDDCGASINKTRELLNPNAITIFVQWSDQWN